MRPTVPMPTTVTKSNVHTPVMMSPVGKIPRVVPGKMNLPLAAAFTPAAVAAVLFAAV